MTSLIGKGPKQVPVNAYLGKLAFQDSVPIASGGTNSTATPTSGSISYGTGTAYAFTAAGTTGQVLTSNGASAPTWTTLSTSSSIAQSQKTANYTLISTDQGKLINCTSNTFTLSVTAATSLGAGWWCYVGNSGSGYITIDPNASETITRYGVASTTWVLWTNEMGIMLCDGSNFYYYPLQKGVISTTVSGSPNSISFSTGLSYRQGLKLSWTGLALNVSDQVSLAVNSTSPVTSSIISESGTIFYNGSANDNLTLSTQSGTGTGQNAINGGGVFSVASNAVLFDGYSRHLNVSNQVVYGTYQSCWNSINISTISSITIAANSQTFAGGVVTLQEL